MDSLPNKYIKTVSSEEKNTPHPRNCKLDEGCLPNDLILLFFVNLALIHMHSRLYLPWKHSKANTINPDQTAQKLVNGGWERIKTVACWVIFHFFFLLSDFFQNDLF